MESNYRNKEFEQYIKQHADQYRMFPSDKVWQGINNSLHTRRKWYGFWLGSLLLMTGAAVTWVMTSQPTPKKGAVQFQTSLPAGTAGNEKAPEKSSQELIRELTPFTKPTVAKPNYTPGPVLADLAMDIPEENNIASQAINSIPVSPLYPGIYQTEKELSSTVNKVYLEGLVQFQRETWPPIEPAVESNRESDRQSFMADAPFTIESVTNAYQFKRPARKISWQLFVTPTVSYRKLSVNKSWDNPSAFNYPFASPTDINRAVTHKPDLGLQLGLNGRYPVTKALNLRGGIQFNINRYDIRAYAFNGEVATIDLNGGTGTNSSISTWTYYRNYAGYKSDWLKNYYFSVSAPFGAELKLFGSEKTNFGIAGTLQPTYIIKDRAYLISTDYKNYAEVPRLIRHVNLNTSFETFVNYESGKTKWQIGPVVRYQILSSFHNKYPVKENLFDFGVKVGLTLNE